MTSPTNDLARFQISSHAIATVGLNQNGTVSGDDMQVATHGYGDEGDWA